MTGIKSFVVQNPWLPCEIEEWSRGPVKHFFVIDLGKMLQHAPSSGQDQEVPYLKSQHVQKGRVIFHELPTMWATPSEIEALRLYNGDLLVCEGGEVGRCANVDTSPPQDCIIQNALHRVRGRNGNNTRYLAYLLDQAAHQGWFDVLCNRSTIAHFTVEKFGDLDVTLPPKSQQRVIADYLDRETARIDALVAAKQGVLALMAEKRRALLTNAVTRGLNPATPLRDSGIPWLGKIPEHWETARAKWLFTERDERSSTGEEELLSLRMEKGLVPHNDVSEKPIRPEELVGYKKTSVGEIVINRMRASSGLISITPQEGLVSPDYAVFRIAEEADAQFFTYLFTTELLQGVFRSESTGLGTGSSGFLRLYSDSFLALWFPLPSVQEQRAIVAHITAETRRLDALRNATERTITLLKERRSALITEAVSGKLQNTP